MSEAKRENTPPVDVPPLMTGSTETLDKVFYRELFEGSPEGIVLLDNDDRVLEANQSFLRIFDYSAEDIVGRTINSLIVPETSANEASRLSTKVIGGGVVVHETVRARRDGSPVHVRILGYPIHRDGEQIGIFAIYRDITVRKRFERRLRLQSAAMDSAANAILITDQDGRIEWVNRSFTRLSGFAEEEAIGERASLLDPDHTQLGLDPRVWQGLEPKAVWRGHVVIRHKGGDVHTVEQTVTRLNDPEASIDHFVIVQEDISEKVEAEERLRHMARHDFLTGLPNRYTFNERLAIELERSARTGRSVAVIVLDLDHFKDVNDTYGHPLGDDLLVAVGKRLLGTVRESRCLARLGGDEFGIVQPDLKDVENARGLAKRLLDAFRNPFVLRGQELHVTPSLGIAIPPEGQADPKNLVKKADMAMYRAKESGRGTFRFYEEEMDREVQQRMRLGQDLHGAVGRRELYLDYQPQIDLATRRIVGVEALLRWRHPKLGMVPPFQFISIAEGSGLIIPMGKWLLRAACAQACVWRDRLGHDLPVAVNLSAIQFRDPQFVDSIEEALAETGLDPRMLELELTEGILMQESAIVEADLERLRRLGVRLSLDDFGTGYSSLEYLRRIPLERLKIDKSFVQGIENGLHDPVIVSVVMALAGKLDLEVIAEGVETQEQLDFLKREGCRHVQGYFFSRPVTPADIERLLLEGDEQIAPTVVDPDRDSAIA